MPVQVADAQAVDPEAVDGAPEEDVLPLPALGNQLGVLVQRVENARVHDRLLLELLAEVNAFDDAAVLLLLAEVERDLHCIPDQSPALLVRLDGPAVGDEGVDIAVDDERTEVSLDDTLKGTEDSCHRKRSLAHSSEQVVLPTGQLAQLVVGDSFFRHDDLLFLPLEDHHLSSHSRKAPNFSVTYGYDCLDSGVKN